VYVARRCGCNPAAGAGTGALWGSELSRPVRLGQLPGLPSSIGCPILPLSPGLAGLRPSEGRVLGVGTSASMPGEPLVAVGRGLFSLAGKLGHSSPIWPLGELPVSYLVRRRMGQMDDLRAVYQFFLRTPTIRSGHSPARAGSSTRPARSGCRKRTIRGRPRPVARPRDLTCMTVRYFPPKCLRPTVHTGGSPTTPEPIPEGGYDRRRSHAPRVLRIYAVRPGDHESDRRGRVRPAVLFAHGSSAGGGDGRKTGDGVGHLAWAKVALAVQPHSAVLYGGAIAYLAGRHAG
jgi:hypothetical protein